MPKNYNASLAVARIREKHGRIASVGTMERRARAMFGTSKNLTARQVIELTRSVGMEKLELSPRVRSNILQHLKLNQKVNKYERKTHSQIAADVSRGLRTPVSTRMIKKVNQGVIGDVRSKGKKAVKAAPNIDHSRNSFVADLRKILHGNFNITLPQAAKKLGLTPSVLQEILATHGTRFVTERKKIKIAIMEKHDAGTERKLSNAELAKKTGLPESFVRDNRKRRGRGSGAEIRRTNLPKEVLTWIGFFTGPKGGVLDSRTLRELTTQNEIDVNTALLKLKKDKFIVEADTKKDELTFRATPGERYFFITSKGQRKINGVGHNPKNRAARFSQMSLDELERIHARLVTVKLSGRLKISSATMNMVTEVLHRKRFEEFKRKNNV